LQQVGPLAANFIPGGSKNMYEKEKNVGIMPAELELHLKNGGILCLFPSGSGSAFHPFYGITDHVWQMQIIRFIKSAKVPVLPVCFQSKPGHLKGVKLKTNSFSAGILKENKKPSIKIRLGNPVNVAFQNKFTDEYQFGRYLRAKVFGMKSKIKVKSFFRFTRKNDIPPQPIISEVPVKKLLVEIQSIESDFTLFKLKNFTVYCAPSSKIPDLLTEIGRLREITFREVGEGTNRSIDIDEYDLYYHQLFIWDHNEKRLAGAYRIGPGREILTQYGKQGFYINTLFSIEDEMTPVLNECLELGRSFIVSDYQRKTLPLFMLWKGILYFLLKNPGYRYLIGPASISNNYSPVSKELIVKFIMKNHFDENLAEWMLPRHEFKFSKNDNLIKTLLQSTENDIDLLDKTVSDLEEQNQGLPVLIKKYIQLNAKIIGFNIDPDFNYSLDGLIFLDAFNIPEQVLESLSKDLNDQALLERFITKKE
jgi:putative hemolysin